MIRAAAPMYVKLGLRNAPNIYPSGLHLEETAIRLGRERVRRAELVLRLIAERAPELVEGRGADTPSDLAIPRPGHVSDVLRLHPVRRSHVRLLRDPDRLGARHPQRASARARSACRRCHRGRAPRALRAARRRSSRPAPTFPTAACSRSRCAGSARELGLELHDDEPRGVLRRDRRLAGVPRYGVRAQAPSRAIPARGDHQLRQGSLRALESPARRHVRLGRHRRGRAELQARPGSVRDRLRDDRRAAGAHPPRRAEPLPRPRAGQAARPVDRLGRSPT